MTYAEAERLTAFYDAEEADKIEAMFKLFAFYNVESTAIATRGDNKALNSYLRQLKSKRVVEENDIDQQFEDAGIG